MVGETGRVLAPLSIPPTTMKPLPVDCWPHSIQPQFSQLHSNVNWSNIYLPLASNLGSKLVNRDFDFLDNSKELSKNFLFLVSK